MSRKVLGYTGLAVVGAGAYYLYSAGGDPKLAEKKFEHDAASASARVRGSLAGRDTEAKKAGEEGFKYIKSQARDLSAEAKAEGAKFDAKFDQYRHDAARKFEETKRETGREINKAADAFDKKVTEGAGKTKSWFGSWFG